MKVKYLIYSLAIVTVAVSFFVLGRFSQRGNVITYNVDGIPTSFNRAWPTYGLPLINYESVLKMIQRGESKDALPYLEAYLDLTVYDAQCRLPMIPKKGRRDIEKGLEKVATYRMQYPRIVRVSTNELDQFWITRQRDVDAFLNLYSSTNSK